MKKTIRPLKKYTTLRLLSLQTQINCAVELAKRREKNPDLSINQLFNDLINDGLAVSHHPIAIAAAQTAEEQEK